MEGGVGRKEKGSSGKPIGMAYGPKGDVCVERIDAKDKMDANLKENLRFVERSLI